MLRFAFFWSDAFSYAILQKFMELFEQKVELAYVVCFPDTTWGRWLQKIVSPLKRYAQERGIPCFQPERFVPWGECVLQMKEIPVDIFFVVSYGKILPSYVLEIPKWGCINLHPSILPKYRWASPLQECLKQGDTTTGITLIKMSEKLDAGDILACQLIDIDRKDTIQELQNKVIEASPLLIMRVFEAIEQGTVTFSPQDESQASYCKKIWKEDGHVFFQKQTGNEIYNLYRAYVLWPWIYSFFWEKKIFFKKIYFHSFDDIHTIEHPYKGSVSCFEKENETGIGIVTSDGIVELQRVLLEWKKETDIFSFLRGYPHFSKYIFP